MSGKKIIQIDEKVPFLTMLPLSVQHVFAMFGASVLVPIIFGIDAGIVLMMNGIGTLLFILITKGKAPAFLGSSFAFIAPVGAVMASHGREYAQGGVVLVGVIGMVLAGIIYKFGSAWIDIVLPPAAMGPIVALIGLELAAVSVNGGPIGANLMGESASASSIAVFCVTLAVAVFGSVLFKGFLGVIPLLMASACDMYPDHSGKISSILFLFGAVGVMVIPWLVGIAAELAGFRQAMLINVMPLGLIVLCSCLCGLHIFRKKTYK